MPNEKPLLELISEKEAELKKSYDLVCNEAEEILSQARRAASQIIGAAEAAGKKTADEYYENEMILLNQDIAEIHRSGEREAAETQAAFEAGLPKIVQTIVTITTG